MSKNLDMVEAFLAVEATMEDYITNIGLVPEHIEEGRVVMSMPIKQNTVNLYGTVHGGALAGLLDTCMGLTCFTIGKQVVTLNMHVNYLKSAKLGEKLTATSSILHEGEGTIVAEAVIVNEKQETVCKGTGSFFIVGNADF